MTASSPRPAGSETTGGELREALLAEFSVRLRPRSGMSERAVERLADAVLALPALRDLIAERDALAAQVQAVEGLHRMVPIKGRDWSTCSVDGDEWPCDTRRALGTPTTGGGE